jgi:Uma2 family endonuclease
MVDSLIAPPVERTEGSVERSVERSITFDEFLVEYAEQHAEWVDGEVILIVNNTEHNDFLLFIGTLLRLFLQIRNLGKVTLAGVPMRLTSEKTGREPDLMILLGENTKRIKATYVDGAADIAIEIVSPESVGRDYGDKFKEYAAAGVQEYWLFDQERDAILLYRLGEHDGKPAYIRQAADSRGRLYSTLLPGLYIDPAWLRAEKRPEGRAMIALIDEMVGDGA